LNIKNGNDHYYWGDGNAYRICKDIRDGPAEERTKIHTKARIDSPRGNANFDDFVSIT